jgi:hypothetical protein
VTSYDLLLSRLTAASAATRVATPAKAGNGRYADPASSFASQLATALDGAQPPANAPSGWQAFIFGRNGSQNYDGVVKLPTADVPAGYTPGPSRSQLEGFNAAKFDPSHPEGMTMKMIAARIFEQHDVYSPTAIDDVVRAFNEAGVPATRVGIDQIDFGNGRGTVDVIRNKRYIEGDKSAGMAWTWLKSDGWKTPSSGTPTVPSTTGTTPLNNPYIPTSSTPFDLSQVTWLHENVSSWPVTSALSNVSIAGNKVNLSHSKAGNWRVLEGSNGGADVEANAWVFVERNGRWYGATWEWLRPGQTTKTMPASAFGSHIKREPLASWAPQPGERIGFMVSTPARDGRRTTNERSNIVMTTWPA